ncbi:glycosyltransferase family 2 protein [Methylocapsa polymorpha]|uniref:Glycosyltransferase family 2 protein n=1 Tax=Methylocapsa polymorpha TaxID=3080828 RepID=A0ABZ0HX43_9HYPH|nr:glycosyltransferase family 2 protein [Methylocapsa sp. RX1]
MSIFRPGRWFRMRYRLSLYEDPTRPVVSFRRGAEEIGWHLLPGPVLGRAEWFGITPDDATAVWISPVSESGQFRFIIEDIEVLSTLSVLQLGLGGDRRRFLSAIGTSSLGWRDEARDNFRWSTQSSKAALWPRYRDRLLTAPCLGDFEAPRRDGANAPAIKLVARLDEGATPQQIDETLISLQKQIYPRWTLSILGAADDLETKSRLASWRAREKRVAAGADWPGLEGDDGDLFGFIGMGDRLARHALACFIAASLKVPDAQVFYCDEEIATAEGETPVFKPDWSPHLQAAKPYVGRMMLTRLAHMRRCAPPKTGPIDENVLAESILRDLGRKEIRHIRRLLTRTARKRGAEREAAAPSRPGPGRSPEASVTIVLPTRDRAEFLRRAISGVLQKTKFSLLDLIVVDNGSVDPDALEALESAAVDPRVKVLQSPGPFNFSALCNLGAAKARGDVVIFLNNDVEIIEPGWVGELASLALDPKVGAVGCKLLYPDRRVQHAGIVLGLGDGVGHFDSGCFDWEPGWLGRNQVVHEASAVTGACLAVERAKFIAVGGFDAVHLPVEFNDVDLCLRLEEAGFQTLWTPFARLIHFESASRGKATFRRLDIHAAERAYFRRRWGDRLRDDPFFHPGLSLFSLSLALA